MSKENLKQSKNQLVLIEFFSKTLTQLQSMDLRHFGDDAKELVMHVEEQLKKSKVNCEAYPADAIEDLIRTIIYNR